MAQDDASKDLQSSMKIVHQNEFFVKMLFQTKEELIQNNCHWGCGGREQEKSPSFKKHGSKSITEGGTGAVTGLPSFQVSNILCADYLALTANKHTHMQAMLNKLQAGRASMLTKEPSNLLGTASLGESQKQSYWGSGGVSAMLLDARTLLLPFSTAARPANSPPEAP
eukprot:1142481-Pelagomonas_calceolata.AAC.5